VLYHQAIQQPEKQPIPPPDMHPIAPEGGRIFPAPCASLYRLALARSRCTHLRTYIAAGFGPGFTLAPLRLFSLLISLGSSFASSLSLPLPVAALLPPRPRALVALVLAGCGRTDPPRHTQKSSPPAVTSLPQHNNQYDPRICRKSSAMSEFRASWVGLISWLLDCLRASVVFSGWAIGDQISCF
jgi:hypothetical protein